MQTTRTLLTALLLSTVALPANAEQTALTFGVESLRDSTGVAQPEISAGTIFQFDRLGLQFDLAMNTLSTNPAYRWGYGNVLATYDATDQIRLAAFVGAEGRMDALSYFTGGGLGAEYRGDRFRIGGSYAFLTANSGSTRQVLHLEGVYDVSDQFSVGLDYMHWVKPSTSQRWAYAGLTGTYNINDTVSLYGRYDVGVATLSPKNSFSLGLTVNLGGSDQLMTGHWESVHRICGVSSC